MGADDELADVRRLLQETTERAQRAEMELELARRTAKDLMDGFSEKHRILAALAGQVLGPHDDNEAEMNSGWVGVELIALARRAKDLTDA